MANHSPITDIGDNVLITYGFKASKALMVGLEIGLFRHPSVASRSLRKLAELVRAPENRLDVLTAAPACDEHLVPGKRTYIFEYFLRQAHALILPGFEHLGAPIRHGGDLGRHLFGVPGSLRYRGFESQQPFLLLPTLASLRSAGCLQRSASCPESAPEEPEGIAS